MMVMMIMMRKRFVCVSEASGTQVLNGEQEISKEKKKRKRRERQRYFYFFNG
jgi:hypothetical protein